LIFQKSSFYFLSWGYPLILEGELLLILIGIDPKEPIERGEVQ
jgi:hypothetical protein